MCVMSFLESCSSEGFYAGLRDQFIEAVGESKLGELKPQLQDIKSIIESSGSVYKDNLKNVKGLDSENGLDRVVNYLREGLFS